MASGWSLLPLSSALFFCTPPLWVFAWFKSLSQSWSRLLKTFLVFSVAIVELCMYRAHSSDAYGSSSQNHSFFTDLLGLQSEYHTCPCAQRSHEVPAVSSLSCKVRAILAEWGLRCTVNFMALCQAVILFSEGSNVYNEDSFETQLIITDRGPLRLQAIKMKSRKDNDTFPDD